MAISKGYFATLKGRKVTFKDDSWGDIKVEFVKIGGDYKVKIADNQSFSYEEISVQIVPEGQGEVKFEVVDNFEDFEIYIEK